MKRKLTILKCVIVFALLCVIRGNVYAAEEEAKLRVPYIISVRAEDNTMKLIYTNGEGYRIEGEWVFDYENQKWVFVEDTFLEEDGYEIWRRENDLSEYTLIKRMTKAQAEKNMSDENEYVYCDKNLKWGTKYTYKIRSYKNDSSSQSGRIYSDFSDVDGSIHSVKLYAYAVKELEQCWANVYYNSVELLIPYGNNDFYYEDDGVTEASYGWYGYNNHLSACSGYEIWRKQEGVDTKYKKIKTIKEENIIVLGEEGKTYVDRNLLWNGTYSYKIRSYRLDDTAANGMVYSKFVVPENGVNLKMDSGTVKDVWTLGKNKSISVMWNGVKDKDIVSYNLYRSAKKNGKYVKIATVGKNSSLSTFENGKICNYYIYTNTNLDNRKTYYYKVSVNKESTNQNKFESMLSGYASGKPNTKYKDPEVTEYGDEGIGSPKIKSGKTTKPGTIVLSWSKVKKANGYVIYRATKKNGKYKQIKIIKKGTTVSASLKAKKGKKYYYKVAAFVNDNKKRNYGKQSAAKLIKCNR